MPIPSSSFIVVWLIIKDAAASVLSNNLHLFLFSKYFWLIVIFLFVSIVDFNKAVLGNNNNLNFWITAELILR